MPVNKWYRGHLDPWWDLQHRNLDYTYYQYKDEQTIDQWREQGYSNERFGGGIYSMSKGLPQWAQKFETVFSDWRDQGIALYEMKTGDILPMHQDHYATYREKFNVVPENIWRAVVFLEDWKSGHYFEIQGIPILSWKSGDWVAWNYDVPHAAANIGTQPRYTAQITGCKT